MDAEVQTEIVKKLVHGIRQEIEGKPVKCILVALAMNASEVIAGLPEDLRDEAIKDLEEARVTSLHHYAEVKS